MSAIVDQLRVNVGGRVQGVSFRYYTRREAVTLGLTGWVRNESDGSVLVVAEGDIVLYAKYSGTEIKLDGDKLLILRESDILAIVE